MDASQDVEYLYCKNCKVVRYRHELEMTKGGLRCTVCKGKDFEESGWVQCPFYKCAVKCAVAGKGLEHKEYGDECLYQCDFFWRPDVADNKGASRSKTKK